MKRTSPEIVQENRDYTLFSWSVQAATNPIHITRGQGVWFWDGEGNIWLDFSSQLINLNIGHQHPKILAAIKEQVDKLCFAAPSFATEPRGALGQKLAEITGLAKAFFTLAGADGLVRTRGYLNTDRHCYTGRRESRFIALQWHETDGGTLSDFKRAQ